MWNLVEIVKFSWNCEIWLKIVKFGWNYEIVKLTDPSDWTTGTGTGELNGFDDFAETITDWLTHWPTGILELLAQLKKIM